MVKELSDKEISDLIAEQKYMRLACQADGTILVVPMCFAVDGDMIVSQTTPGRKVEMMRENPAVCLQFDQIHDLTSWKSVVLSGRFEELTGDRAIRATCLLIDKYGEAVQEKPSSDRGSRDVAPPRIGGQFVPPLVFGVHIEEKSGRSETP